MRYLVAAAVLLVALPMVLCAGIGEITYIEGSVEIARGRKLIDEMDLETGSEIQNFDQISTGEDGQLFILIDSENSPATEIHIAQNTVFTVELNSIERKETTTLQLITGSLALNVRSQNRYGERARPTSARSARGRSPRHRSSRRAPQPPAGTPYPVPGTADC